MDQLKRILRTTVNFNRYRKIAMPAPGKDSGLRKGMVDIIPKAARTKTQPEESR